MLILSKNKDCKLLIEELKRVSGFLYEKGWAEANAGNFSVNISHLNKWQKVKSNNYIKIKLNNSYNYLKNNTILTSATGSRMRNIAKNPVPDACLLYIDETGKNYYINKTDKKPTSEILAHLGIQNTLSKNNALEKVVLHTHPAEVIAITHIKKFCNEKALNNLMYSIQPEVSFIFPEGIGFVPYLLTGSEKLAIETRKKFENHKIVIWEKHGCVATGKNFDDAFDKIDVLVKSLKIYFMCRMAGNKPYGINVYGIKELKKLTQTK
jgi:rhamnulose-1-phosphate aldolase